MSSERPPPPSEPNGANRRQFPRCDVEWEVNCEADDTFLYATIANISAMGIFVFTEEPLAPGTVLRLKFSPQGAHAAAPFELEGVVQWVNPPKPGCPNPGMGVRFESLALTDRERLVETIRTISYLRPSALPPSIPPRKA